MSFLDWILTLLVMVSTVILNVADYDEEDEDEESVPAVEPPRVSHHAPRVCTSNSAVIKRRRTEGGEASCSFANGSMSQESEWNLTDVDGLACPICMDAWTNNGEHHICCNRKPLYLPYFTTTISS